MKIVIEKKIRPRADITTDDGGVYKEFVLEEQEDLDNGLFFRICSWCEKKKHIDFKKFVGKKVRLTLEVVEEQ